MIKTIASGLAIAVSVLAIGACGGGGERQDENEPEAEFPVALTTAKFPHKQNLAGVTDLRLGVENTGDETIPNLAITLFIEESADDSFSVRLQQPGLSNPNRPVWVLEETYPRLVGESRPPGSSPADIASANTFAWGPLKPGKTREMVWKVTPVKPGKYAVNYEVAAGLAGNAQAVTDDGDEVAGEFVADITDVPAQQTVNEAGKVVEQ